MKKNILGVTSSRADYDLQKEIFKKITLDDKFNFNLLITGSHSIKKQGFSLQIIKKDKYYNNFFITNFPNKLEISNDYLINKYQREIYKKIKTINPIAVILLGDRVEILLFALVCNLLNITIFHISGGETTLGSKDDIYRDCITRFSNFHFVSHIVFKKRITSINKNSKNIFVTGSLGAENIHRFLKKKKTFINSISQLNLNNFYIVNFHPSPEEEKLIMLAINSLTLCNKKIHFLFTSPNIDKGGENLFKKINIEIKKNDNFLFKANLGQDLYFNLLKYAKGVIGNSSSGLTEVPLFSIPTFNIGFRQEGRLKASSVIDIKNVKELKKLTKNIEKIDKGIFVCDTTELIFKNKNASKIIYNKIIDVIK